MNDEQLSSASPNNSEMKCQISEKLKCVTNKILPFPSDISPF